MKIKDLLWVAGIVAILALIPSAILFYQNQVLKDRVSRYAGDLDITYKKLSDSIQRAETKRAEDFDELFIFAEQNNVDIKAIEDDLKSLGGRLEAVASTKAKTTNVVHNHYPSDSNTSSDIDVPTCEEDGRPIDVHGYTKRVETKQLTDSNGMRVADVSFSAAQKRPWSSKVYGINYTILNTIGRGEDDQIILSTELIARNPQTNPEKTFRIEGIESRVLQAPKAPPQFDFWDPSIFLMANLGMAVYDQIGFSASLGLGFSIFSYGEDWRFLGISAGYDGFRKSFRASLFPVAYNVGSPLPLISDLWVGLDLGASHTGEVSIGVLIGTTL